MMSDCLPREAAHGVGIGQLRSGTAKSQLPQSSHQLCRPSSIVVIVIHVGRAEHLPCPAHSRVVCR